MGKRLLPRWHAWRTKRKKYKGVPFDYILKDKYHPYVSDPGDNENPGLLLDGTVVMHPVFAKAKDSSGKPDPFGFKNMSDDLIYNMYERLLEPETVLDLHLWRWYRDNPESEAERLLRIQQNEPLEIVSPEFDALTLGMGIKDLWKGWRALKAMPKSYTGVPLPWADNFPNWNGKIWTTDDLQMAKEYAKGGFGKWNNLFGEGTVYKIYGKDLDKGLYTKVIPEPPKGYAYLKERVPYKLSTNGENGSVKQLAKVEDADLMPNGAIIEDHGVIDIPNAKGAVIPAGQYESIDVMASNANMKNTRTNVLVIPHVVDNSYKVGGKYITPAMTERVYIPHIGADIIRAPLSEPEFMTALKNTTNFGGITSFGTGLTRYGFNNNGL